MINFSWRRMCLSASNERMNGGNRVRMSAPIQFHQSLRPRYSSGFDRTRKSLRILFIHADASEVERCLQELSALNLKITSEVVRTPLQFSERLRSQRYDLIVAEHPSCHWARAGQLELTSGSGQRIPLIFIGNALGGQTVAEFITKGAFDCIEMAHIGHLPVAVCRAIDEKRLREERDHAEKMLRHSEAKYSALIGNLTYGLFRCDEQGKFLDANQALISMLGYDTRQELLCANLASDIISNPATRAHLLRHSTQEDRNDPFEIDWKRKDGTTLKVRLSGRAISSNEGETGGYEIVAEDVTKQRKLEDDLRHQATRDPLTGLANYRQLVDTLDSEIKRTTRTRRGFALLLIDLDGLKQINDRHGHVIGNLALRRLAGVLCLCSRSVDTASRFGGDEFALVLPETTGPEADLVARRISGSLANDRTEPVLSVSIGMATYPKDAESLETLLSVADGAMYAMKRQLKSALRLEYSKSFFSRVKAGCSSRNPGA